MIHHHIVNVAAALSMSYYCKLSWERYRDISSRFGKLHQSSGGIPLYLLICVCGSDKQRGITQTQDQDGWICIGNTHVNVTFRQSPIDLLSPHVSKPMSNNTSLVPIEEILPGSIPGSPLEQFKYFSMHSLVPPVCQRTSKVCCFYQNMVILCVRGKEFAGPSKRIQETSKTLFYFFKKNMVNSQKLMTPKPEALLLVGTIPSIIRRWWKDLMT